MRPVGWRNVAKDFSSKNPKLLVTSSYSSRGSYSLFGTVWIESNIGTVLAAVLTALFRAQDSHWITIGSIPARFLEPSGNPKPWKVLGIQFFMLMPIQFEGVQSIMASIRAKALDTINNESPAPMPMHTAQGSLKLNFRTKGKPGKEWLGDASKGQHATTYSKLAYYSIQLVRRPSCAVSPWQRGSTRNHTHRSSPHELPRSPGTQGEDFLSSSVLRALCTRLLSGCCWTKTIWLLRDNDARYPF